MSDQLFSISQRFSAAVEIINEVVPKRLLLILQRIISKLHLQKSEAFSTEEQERLQEVLGLREEQLHTLMEICSFIYEQAAYVQLTLQQLKEQLEKAGLNKEQNISFLKAWDAEGANLIAALKKRTVVPQTLEATKWRLHLQTSQSDLARVKTPTAIFDFELKDSATQEKSESLVLEFSHDELYKFYENLEMIQEQLDMLS